jgi:TPR repeat protein
MNRTNGFLAIIIFLFSYSISLAYPDKLSEIKINELTELATNGDVKSQIRLGYLYEEGISVKQDFISALQWYLKASQQGDALAQWHCGLIYESGKGIAKDYKEAIKWYKKSAEQGYSPAQFNMGAMYEYSKGVEQNYSEAIKWYRVAAEQGDDKAKFKHDELYKKMMQSLTFSFNNIKLPNNDTRATQSEIGYNELLNAAQKGDVNAQLKLGEMYRDGIGVTINFDEAIKWFTAAAKNGSKVGKQQLSILMNKPIIQQLPAYKDDNSNVNNSSVFLEYLNRAERGDVYAQFKLGCMYEDGEYGVVQNYSEALKWYKKAAKQGDNLSQCCIGFFYQFGYSVPVNYNEAIKWYKMAADHGYSFGLLLLGNMYQYGHGVSLSFIEADVYYRLSLSFAKDNDDKNRAFEYIVDIENNMRPEQILQAKVLYRERLRDISRKL